MNNKLGFSGGVAARFQNNALTPLLALAAIRVARMVDELVRLRSKVVALDN